MPKNLILKVEDHNKIKGTFDKMDKFHGPSKRYIARLFEGGTIKDTINTTTLTFTFDNLRYSTQYTVQVGISCPRLIQSLNQYFKRFSVHPVDVIQWLL